MNKHCYFSECKTAEDVKKTYRDWAKKLHPDCGGDEEEFKALQSQFEAAWNMYKNIHVNSKGETYEKENTETAGEFMDIINALLKLEGVETELCGSWIWCSGNTKQHKDTLKELHFRFSSGKQAWYFHSEPYRKRSKRKMSLNDIRNMYGSKHFKETSAGADSENKMNAITATA